MECVNLMCLLDADPRPSFVVDTHNPPESLGHVRPAYVNKSLRSQSDIFQTLTANTSASAKLRIWANTVKPIDASRQEDHVHVGPAGALWFAYLVEERWRVVQRFQSGPSTIGLDIITPPVGHMDEDRSLSVPRPLRQFSIHKRDLAKEAFALTEEAIENFQGLGQHLDLILDFDWSATCLGPIERWPSDLLQVVHLMLLNPAPQCLFMGPQHILIYNVGYAQFSGERHPAILGGPVVAAWPEAIELNMSIFTFIDTTGRPFIIEDFNISVNRNGYLEELYLKWTTIPLKGSVCGYLCTAYEETARKVTERRKALLQRISAACRGIRDMSSFWKIVLQALSTNPKDFPFALIYSKALDHDTVYNIEGMLDAEEPSHVLPASIDLATNKEPFISTFRDAQHSTSPLRIRSSDCTLPECLVHLSTKRGSGDRCHNGLVCPIRRYSDNRVLGLLVVGTNTRKAFTPEDQAYVQYMMSSLGDLATNTFNAQETDRVTRQAATRHQTLVDALASTATEANQILAKWQRLVMTTEMVEVGVFELDLDGTLMLANEAYYHMSGHSRDPDSPPMTWQSLIHPADLPVAIETWEKCLAMEHANVEVRFKFHDGHPTAEREGLDGFWVLCAVVPVVDPETGNLVSISGCITNIGPQKRRQLDALEKAQKAERLRASEERFNRFASHAVCPIMIYDTNQKLQFCNDAYYAMMGFEKGDSAIWETSWVALILEEDLPGVMEQWVKTVQVKKALQLTCRLRKLWTAPDGTTGPTWIVAASYPEVDDAGDITGWVGVCFDISQTKWAEVVQQKRLDEAVEARRQQTEFIDMTSHEIRNPLGAVVHCADSILASLVDLETIVKEPSTELAPLARKQLLEICDSASNAVSTIISCSTHQRRIVDDVLTWSKLNSSLLKITPSLVRPSTILQDIRNMFELDAAKVGVKLTVQQAGGDNSDDSVAESGWVMLDPGRLMQVLINLIGNAIKFTRQESGTRTVTVTMGITASAPSLDRLPVDFVSATTEPAPMDAAEWGIGAPVHLYFLVEDTGCGLSPDEKSKIFARFSQGSPRTHTKYGGSGLGLYISRELVELHAGQVGFASQAGEGSKFGFFVRGRHAASPAPSRRGSAASSKVAATAAARGARLSNSALGLGRRYSILVVEDNQVNQAVLSQQLRKLGHEVHVANHGGEALRFIKSSRHWRGQAECSEGPADTPMGDSFPPPPQQQLEVEARLPLLSDGSARDALPYLSVVLMDVEMPVMDGLSCTKEIRRLQDLGLIDDHIPIIAVSANARSAQVGLALSCGMDDAIAKPFRIVDLMPKIERLVG